MSLSQLPASATLPGSHAGASAALPTSAASSAATANAAPSTSAPSTSAPVQLATAGNAGPIPPSPIPSNSAVLPPPIRGEWDRHPLLHRSNLVACVCWLLGLGGFLGHHFLYEHLDGQRYQPWTTPAGIALGMFVKVCWGFVMEHAYLQGAWRTLRKAGRMPVEDIDALFAVPQEPLRLLLAGGFRRWRNRLVFSAKSPAVLALFLFLMVFFTTAPPSALEVDSRISYANGTGLFTVPTLDFQASINGLPVVYSDGEVNGLGYDRLNSRLLYIAESAVLSGTTRLPPSPCGANCSYDIQLYSPGYFCQDVPFEDTPFGSDAVLRTDWTAENEEGTRSIYVSEAIQGNLWFAFSRLRPGVRDFINITLGENKLWDADKAGDVTDEDYLYNSFVCTDWNASYDITLSFEGEAARAHVNQRQLVNTINYAQGQSSRETGHHEAVHGFMARWLQGNITLEVTRTGNRPTIPENLRLYSTGLVNTSEPFGDDETEYFYAVPHLRDAVQELHANISLSMLSAQPFFYFIRPAENYPCAVIQSFPVYTYKPMLLLAIYIPTAVLSLLVLLYGVGLTRQNGAVHGSNFSTFLATCQNPDLKPLAAGSSLGRAELGAALRNADLGFGKLPAGVPPGALASFGFGPTVHPITKYENYS